MQFARTSYIEHVLISGNALGIWFCGCRLFPKGLISYTLAPPRIAENV